jgi:hypothetical protein
VLASVPNNRFQNAGGCSKPAEHSFGMAEISLQTSISSGNFLTRLHENCCCGTQAEEEEVLPLFIQLPAIQYAKRLLH